MACNRDEPEEEAEGVANQIQLTDKDFFFLVMYYYVLSTIERIWMYKGSDSSNEKFCQSFKSSLIVGSLVRCKN